MPILQAMKYNVARSSTRVSSELPSIISRRVVHTALGLREWLDVWFTGSLMAGNLAGIRAAGKCPSDRGGTDSMGRSIDGLLWALRPGKFRPMIPLLPVNSRWGLVLGTLLSLGAVRSACAASDPAGMAYFEQHIRPLLISHCYECHGVKKQKGGLRLDSQAAMLRGGDNGAVLVTGKPEESLMIRAVSYQDPNLKMPPKQKLSPHLVDRLREWIKLGAPDPRTDGEVVVAKAGIDIEAGRKFWSFQPLIKPAVPQPRNSTWGRSEIDAFILARLEASGLKPNPDADRQTLIRRVYFDLTGLPPSPEQIDAFLKDTRADAFERVVDDLLASPHYGEHWGRHWLDIARYAESSGGGRTLLFKEAWRYRDYVVDAFNQDKPFGRFVTEQIAGDLLPAENAAQRESQLVATAYLALGPTNYERQDKDVLEADVVDEQLDVIGKGLLGMTISCARCHDHKFDPIPTADYYAMAGILKSTQTLIHDNVSRWVDVELPVAPEVEVQIKEHGRQVAALEKQIQQLKARSSPQVSVKGPIDPAKLPGLVIDSADAKRVGEWVHSTHSGTFVGDGYLHDGNRDKGQKTLTFVPKFPKEGRYEVRLAYVPSANRASNVPVTVLHADGESNLVINQKDAPPLDGRFITLGQFRFDTNEQWFVLISNEDTDGHVIVDAVQFISLDDPETVRLANVTPLPLPAEVDRPEMIPFIVPDPKTLAGIVVDDTGAELVGEWKKSVHTPPFVGAGYLHDDKTGKGEKSATYRPNLPAAGEYEVRLAHNFNVRRTTNAPVTIHHAGGDTRLVINQQEEAPLAHLFRSLGTFHFAAGTSGYVRITTEGTDGKNVIADAVQFLPTGDALAKATSRAAAPDAAAELKKLEAELKGLKAKGPKRPLAMGVREADQIADTYINIRGVLSNKGPVVPRGVLQVASLGTAPKIGSEHSGRREMAEWLTSGDNPLTARVFANRAWYWLTGSGLVRTVDNFGVMGEQPSHPELLDWLAVRFRDQGWSVKGLVKEIVMSRTYQLSSTTTEASFAKDPENKLRWRMNRRRLPAEAIRDTMLASSGQLDLAIGGSTIKPGTTIEYGYEFDDQRRSLYTPVFRNSLLELFESFDFADPNMVAGRRNNSTTATQGLYLMNHPFVMSQARTAARQTLSWSGLDDAQRITRAYRQALGRPPTGRELQLGLDFVTAPPEENETPDRRLDAWIQFHQMLMASLDFRYLN